MRKAESAEGGVRKNSRKRRDEEGIDFRFGPITPLPFSPLPFGKDREISIPSVAPSARRLSRSARHVSVTMASHAASYINAT